MFVKRERYKADIVVPCFNEQEALPITASRIITYFRNLVDAASNELSSFRILFIDDGSKDRTWKIIEELAKNNSEVLGVRLARNYGHQSAMLSGLSVCDADVAISMDADLQDDITAVEKMLTAFESGAHLALGVREERKSDTSFKRQSANAYYWLLSLLGVNVVRNHADFRLMSKQALSALLQHEEVNLFLRGLIPSLGFSVTLVPYSRQQRIAGKTKYTLRKMLRLGLDGITSFSVVPLRGIAVTGGVVFSVSTIIGLYFLAERIFAPEDTAPGWASTVLPLLFLGGLQILSIGILGEYVGKIYMEVKRRPRFLIQETTAR